MGNKNQLSIRSIVAIGIGAALFFVLGRFVAIPTPVPNTNLNIQYGILGVFGTIFGPVVGVLIGLIGHVLIDLSWGSPWWSWILASAIFGLVVGFSKKRIDLDNGVFGMKEIITFNVIQVIGHVLAFIAAAPVLDILIYSEPIEKAFLQGATACGFNALTTAVIGTIILIAYAKTRTKAGSLQKEN